MKKLWVIGSLLMLFAVPLFGAPAAVPDLAVDDATSGFRHVGLAWTVPYDAVASTPAAYYEVRVSSFRPIVTDADWDGNSGLTAYPYRIKWSTAGAVAGERDSLVVTGLADGQTYFFALRSSTDNITWSAIDSNPTRPFKAPFNSPPAVVGGHNYNNNAIADTLTPTLAWTAPSPSVGGSDASYGDYIASYTVEISRYLDFSLKTEQAGLTMPFWTTPPLVENASYYWRVKAGDVENLYSTAYADQVTVAFYVNAVNEAPAAFDLVSPLNGLVVSTSTPALQWNASSDPDPWDTITYTLWYSTAADFALAVTTAEANIAATQKKPADHLIENATYYWKASAVDMNGRATMAISTGTFRVNVQNSVPLPFALASPADGGTVGVSTPTLAWNPAVDLDPDDAVTYNVMYTSGNPDVPEEYAAVNGLAVPQCIVPALQEDTTYWWKVQAADTHFGIVESARYSFYVDAVHIPPSVFHLLSSSGVVHDARPPFTWSSPGDADAPTYTLYVSTAADFAASFSSAGLTGISFVPAADLAENTTYWWKVRAENVYGLWRVSQETWTVVIDAVPEPPQAFSLISPADGAAVSALKPLLVWQASADPDPGQQVDRYLLYYSTAADFSASALVSGIAVSSCAVPAVLAGDTTYYWKVVAVSNLGEGTTSQQSWCFVTQNQPPDSFNLSSPSGMIGSSTVPFSWVASFDPDGDPVTYSLQYSTCPDFQAAVSSSGLAGTGCTVTSFAENKTYYWRVEAIDVWGNRRASSQTLSFSVNAAAEPPAPFNLLSPADGARLTTLYPLFSWQAAADPDPGDTVSYLLWYSPDPSFAVKTVVNGIAAPSCQAATGLSLNTTYYWRVYAVGSDGMQRPSSTTRSFLIEERCTLAGPTGFGATLAADRKSVALRWDAVTKYADGTALAATPGYRVYKAYDFNSLFGASPLVSLSTGTLNWTDNDVRSLPVYYLVRAYTLSGDEGVLSVVQQVGAENLTYSYTDDRDLTVAYSPEVVASSASVIIARYNSEESGEVLRSYQVGVQYGDGTAGTSFRQPFTLAFKLSAFPAAPARKASAPAAGDYAVYWFNGVEWISLGGQVSGDAISVQTVYAGRYQVRAIGRAGSFSMLKAWPKTVTPNGDGINDEFNSTFENPAGNGVEGRIFDLTGNRVARMKARSAAWLFWNGRDEDDRAVPPGIYLYQINCGDAVYNGTVVVAR